MSVERQANADEEPVNEAMPQCLVDMTAYLIREKVLTPEAIALLGNVSAQIKAVIRKKEVEIERLKDEIGRDRLTALHDFEEFKRRLKQRIIGRRYDEDCTAILFVDLFDFKHFNDHFNDHVVGDVVIAGVAAVLRSNLRPGDFACRRGGDEFMVLLTGITRPADAIRAARRIARGISENQWSILDGRLNGHTPSADVGVAYLRAFEPVIQSQIDDAIAGRFTEELIAVADTVMYKTKKRHHQRRMQFIGFGELALKDGLLTLAKRAVFKPLVA